MQAQYREQADFLAVYIREAHPTDEWHAKYNEKEGICYLQPKTIEQRVAIARDFAVRFEFPVPLLVDGMENQAEKAYAAWPDRLYVVDEAGVIRYKGKPGPYDFNPDEVASWLRQRFPEQSA